ncbi:MAG: YbfB/YjiJ family MFS transporter [Pseudomonadota bacterium]
MLSTSARWVVGATLTMAAALGVGRFAYTPLLPEMTLAFGWSYGQAGDLASANFLGYLAGALMAPKLAVSPQVRAWVALSLMGTVLTTFLGSEADLYWQWVVLRFLGGVASAICLVGVTAHLIQVLARQGTEHLGNIHFAGVGLGILLCMAGVFLGGGVAEQWSRQGLIAAVCVALAWVLLREGPWLAAPTVQGADSDADEAGLWPVIVGYGLFGFGYVVSATFVVAMGENLAAQGIDPRASWVAVGAGTLPSVYLWQWFAQRRGLALSLRVAYAVLAVGTLLAGWVQSVWALLFAAVLLGGTFAGITALGLSAGRQLAPQRVAAVVSIMTVAFSIGQLLGPAVAGRMADVLGGFFWPSVLATSLVLVALLLVPKQLR